MLNFVNKLIREEEGQAMAEYGLILALVAVAVITAVKLIGTDLNTKFGQITNEL